MRGLLASTVLLLTSVLPCIAAEPQLTARQAETLLNEEAKTVPVCGAIFYLTEFDVTTVGGNVLKQLNILNDMGIIQLVPLSGLSGITRSRVQLKPGVDPTIIHRFGPNANGYCLIASNDSHPVRIEVLKVDMIKGGVTNWHGAIAYVKALDKKYYPTHLDYLKRGWV
jgi:hypothetical protein